MEKERIAKFLARAGVASRRESERLIESRRVVLNGTVVSHPATMAGADDVVAVDGTPIARPLPAGLWRYHKPAGLVTTARDPEGRPTVFSALPKGMARMVSVGRLDINTEGLLLLTNDGELARYLEHPAQEFSRSYRVRAHGHPDEAAVARLAKGMTINGVRYRPIEASFERRQGGNWWISMTLREGKNREIKRLLEELGMQVTRLIRTGYGPFELGKIAPGELEEVPSREFRKLLPGYFA